MRAAPGGRLELGFEHEGARPVPAPSRVICTGDVDAPVTVFGVSEQRGETGAGVETGQAQPIDRPVAAHECRRLAVSYQCVLFNRQSHQDASVACAMLRRVFDPDAEATSPTRAPTGSSP